MAPLRGTFTAEQVDPGTGLVVARHSTPNLVTTGGKSLTARLLLGRVTQGLTFHTLGTGTDTPTARDFKLDDEEARRGITTREDTLSPLATFFTYWSSSESNLMIEEVGIFGGPTASSTPNSGILFARALLSVDNTGGTDLVLSYVLTVG